MKRFIRTFLLLLYFLFSLTLAAQQKLSGNKSVASNTTGTNAADPDNEMAEGGYNPMDSLLNVGNPLDVKTYSYYADYIGFQTYTVIDTTLHNLEYYNPTKQALHFYQDLGITGSANTPLVLQFNPDISSSLGFHAFDLYLRDISEVELIETPTPFTQLSYVQGAKKENILRVQHAQSFIDKRVKVGMDFKLYNAEGYYSNQKKDVKNFSMYSDYSSKDNRYSVRGIYFHNKLVLQENGGILYDSLYSKDLETNRQIITVNLNSAENYIKYSGIGIKQHFYIAKAEPDFSAIPDTNVINYDGYSVYHYKKPYFDPITPLGRLTHTFLYSKEAYVYTDNDGSSNFYASLPNFPAEITSVFDSISHWKIENTFEYSNADYKDKLEKPKFLSYSFGLGIVTNRYGQDTIVRTISELNPQGKLQVFLTKKIRLFGSGIYSYRSDNSSSYLFEGHTEIVVKKNSVDLSFSSSSTQAPWFYQHFYSSYFQWENNFQNQKQQEINFLYKRPLTQISAKLGLIHDYLYFDKTATPQQFNVPISFYSISAYQGIKMGHFGIDLNLVYQGVSESDIVRVPKFYSNTKFFFTSILFSGALDLELAVNVRYYSKYYANAYMPALRSFYLQDEQLIGDYPYVDLIVNAKIKRARIFFKYEQFNASYMPQNYFIGPHYPNPDASISFGVIWQLFN
ncbi:MAG: hypothetical protein JW857_00875 [Bacteroidales bacterium]|nr:hypothetical protein [Bacteroidales bacterium]